MRWACRVWIREQRLDRGKHHGGGHYWRPHVLDDVEAQRAVSVNVGMEHLAEEAHARGGGVRRV